MDNGLYLRKNLNTVHRIIRVFIGVVLIGWSAISLANSWWIAIISALGGIQIFEGLISY
ncbi:DUF2892 domain-containing protein [Robertmurraya sp.]|uniref:YgaP family membrane protein n=1 Tax=Robertmurraya sp. TaxID=2837525 RepID=UPI003703895A